MLPAEGHFEANGWRLIHGIVDSIWVEDIGESVRNDYVTVVHAISDEVRIRLEYERAHDWICIVPPRESATGY